jgi:hypothetical protein
LHAERDARAIQEDRGLESLALKARRLQEIDEADRAFESDRVEGDKSLSPGCAFTSSKTFSS